MSSPLLPARPRSPKALLALCAVALAVVGCSTGNSVGMAKTDSARSTVAADANRGQVVPASANANLAPAKLRLVSPCGLMDNATMARFGTGGLGANQEGIDACDDDLTDGRGNNLDLTVTLGADLSQYHPTGTIAGLPVAESSDHSACFERIITTQNPQLGIEIQADYDNTNSCPPARQFAELVIGRIRTDPPLRGQSAGSLAAIDPCTTVDDRTAATVLGGPAQKQENGLFECGWHNDNDNLTVTFSIDVDPKTDTSNGTPKPVDIGVPAEEFSSTDVYPSCDVTWLTHATGHGVGDVVDVQFGNVADTPGVDACADTVTVAKAVATKVPSTP